MAVERLVRPGAVHLLYSRPDLVINVFIARQKPRIASVTRVLNLRLGWWELSNQVVFIAWERQFGGSARPVSATRQIKTHYNFFCKKTNLIRRRNCSRSLSECLDGPLCSSRVSSSSLTSSPGTWWLNSR